jgi:hypothetical protein
LYSVFLPIVEKLTEENLSSSTNLKLLIANIPVYCTKEVKHEFKDIAIN